MSDDDYHRRTAITRLDVSLTDESLLRHTIEEWKQGCQIAVDKAWERCHSKSDVRQLAYDEVRENTHLGSQHAILACHQAAENIKSCISRRQDGKTASKPTYTSETVIYDSRTMTVFPEKEQVSLTTTATTRVSEPTSYFLTTRTATSTSTSIAPSGNPPNPRSITAMGSGSFTSVSANRNKTLTRW